MIEPIMYFGIGFLVAAPVAFDARTYVWLLWRGIDWVAMAEGLAFTAIILALAAEYRRRRIT